MTRQKYLDYLRAFSAICVIGIHTHGPFFQKPAIWSPTGIVGGIMDTMVRVGLPLFFMISGALLLATPYASASRFYLKRFPKILIPFILYSAAYYAYVHTFEKPSPMSVSDFGMALVREPQFYHLWFVYSLIGLYFITPFLSVAVNQIATRTLWTAILILLAILQVRVFSPLAGIQINGAIFLVSPWLLYFAGGYAITRLDAHQYKLAFLGLTLFGFISTFFARAAHLQIGIFDQSLNMYALAFGVFGLFMGAKQLPADGAILDRVMSTISKYSYEIYLVHPLVLIWLRDKVFEMTEFHPIWNTFLLTSTVLFGSLLVAAVIQTLVTGPCVRVADRLAAS
ncbi:acyltransferase [Cupriavidus sp.]|jgi:surface polysaccharide O-acyltransferase-like enzyme|uniref:acyltransferase n=1 Tax=Cupriavidus sp. TaxID=1873897 RepID=UPI0028BE753A|nr:acyltransferase family protein [Cupriavidus sp.]